MPRPPKSLFDWIAPRRADEPPAAALEGWAKSTAPPPLTLGAPDPIGWRSVGAALGLALAGVSAPIAVTAMVATGGLLGPPFIASALVGLLVLGPAGVGLATALSGLRRVASTLGAQGGSDAEQAVLRVFATALVFGYSLGLAPPAANSSDPGGSLAGAFLPIAGFGLVAAWAILLHVILWPVAPPVRRIGAMTLDIVLISAFLHAGGGEVTGWYPLYLLAIFHAGWRFGLGALLGTAIGSILGFAAVILSTDVWRHQPALATGLILALAVLPALFAGAIRAIASARAATAEAEAGRQRMLLLIADSLQAPSAELAQIAAIGASGDGPALGTLASRIGDVADFAALEAGRVAAPVETFNLRALVNCILVPLQVNAAENGVALRWRIDPHLPSRLRGRAQAFARILGGLAGHAVETAPAGTVRIAIDAAWADTRRLGLRLLVDGAGNDREWGSAPGEDPLALRLVQRRAALLGSEFAIDRIPGRRSRLTVTLVLAIEEGAAAPVLDLGGRPVLIATEDEAFASEFAALLCRWNADARWVGDVDGALADLAYHGTPQSPASIPVLIIDGSGRFLPALSLAHRAAQLGGDAPFILLAADAGQIQSLGTVDDGEIDGFIPLPVGEALLANALQALPLGPLEPPGPDRPATRSLVDPPRTRGGVPGEIGEPTRHAGAQTTTRAAAQAAAQPVSQAVARAVAQAVERITPIAAHPKFAPDTAATLDMRAIDGLRALGGGPDFLAEVIEIFRADARQIMERIDRAVAAADAAGFGHNLNALRRAASPLGGTRLCELLASLHGLSASELRRQGAVHVQRLDAEVDRLAAALIEFLPPAEARLP